MWGAEGDMTSAGDVSLWFSWLQYLSYYDDFIASGMYILVQELFEFVGRSGWLYMCHRGSKSSSVVSSCELGESLVVCVRCLW